MSGSTVATTVPGLAQAARRGWSSGASGEGVTDHSFSQWRGSPVTVAGAWADQTAEDQEQVPAVTKEYADWSGDLDIAVGGTVLGSGESYRQAAAGAYAARWTTMARTLQQHRGDGDGVTYVRPFHEFNGNWYENWFVTPERVDDYKASFRAMAKILRENCPSCVVVWSPNNHSSAGAAPLETAYPGDDVVDVIAVDSYNANGNAVVTSPEKWDEYATAGTDSEPSGVETWRRFAERHGKPIAFSEWGLTHEFGGGDNPQYIESMNAWMSQHAARPGEQDLAGKVLYDVYFNVVHRGSSNFLIKDGPNPRASETYRRLPWGSGSLTSAPSPTSSPSPTSTPSPTSGATPAGPAAPPLPPVVPSADWKSQATASTSTPAAASPTKPPAVTSSGSAAKAH